MSDEVFGPIVSAAEVEDWTLASLQLWAPEYLAWTERRTGRTPHDIPQPATWSVAATVEGWPTGALPSVLVVSPGLRRHRRRRRRHEPIQDGTGSLRGKYVLGVAVAVGADTREDADRLARDYGAALRALMLHNQSLGGHVEALELTGERYSVLPDDGATMRAVAHVRFLVDVRDLVATRGGPKVPRPDPYAPYPASPLVELSELEVDADIDD